jgi:hypothetical protein
MSRIVIAIFQFDVRLVTSGSYYGTIRKPTAIVLNPIDIIFLENVHLLHFLYL